MKFVFIVLFLMVTLPSLSQELNLFEVEKLTFCKDDFDEYNVSPYKNGAYINSNHSVGGMRKIRDRQNNNLASVFYQSNLESKRKSINKLDIKLNYHIGAFSLNSTNDCMVFTAQRSNKDLVLSLYITYKEKNRWTKPKLIFDGYEKMNLMDPFLSTTGDTLFFVANMLGGYGGTDIYMATGNLGFWPSLSCMKSNINTSFNERYPKFYNKKLYYSSTRSDGHGGLDLYSVDLTKDGFVTEAFHFQDPINSDYDDFAYTYINKDLAYFSSDRKGNVDIYKVKMNYPEFDCFTYIESSRCYEFYEESDDNTDSSLYQFEWKISDGGYYTGDIADHCFKDTGLFQIELNLIDKATGDYSNVANYEIEILDPDQLELYIPNEIGVHQNIMFRTQKSESNNETRYFWDFGDGNYGFGKEVSHTYRRPGEYQVSLGKIEFIDGVQNKKCTSKIISILP